VAQHDNSVLLAQLSAHVLALLFAIVFRTEKDIQVCKYLFCILLWA
jgi:hypothetical protein